MTKALFDYSLLNRSVTCVFGVTGSGKTYLARHFFNKFDRAIVYKYNFDDEFKGVIIYDMYSLFDFLHKHYYDKKFKIVYDNELKDVKDFQQFCFIVREFAKIAVFYEEINIYANSYFCPRELKININTGRHRELSQFFVCQRVAKVSGDILSQSKNIITFSQKHHRDIEILSEFFDSDEIRNLGQYEFLFWSREKNKTEKYILYNNKIITL